MKEATPFRNVLIYGKKRIYYCLIKSFDWSNLMIGNNHSGSTNKMKAFNEESFQSLNFFFHCHNNKFYWIYWWKARSKASSSLNLWWRQESIFVKLFIIFCFYVCFKTFLTNLKLFFLSATVQKCFLREKLFSFKGRKTTILSSGKEFP